MTDVRLIASDLDRTLLTHDYVLPDRVVEAVGAVLTAGIKVVIATARSPIGVSHFAQRLGLGGLVICFNGAWIGNVANGQATFSMKIDGAIARQVMETAYIARLNPLWFSGEAVHVVERNASIERETAKTGEPVVVAPLSDLPDAPHKIMCVADQAEDQLKFERLRATFGQTLTVARSHPRLLEIGPKAVSKRAAVANVAKALGLRPEQCAAVGDAENDLEMLAWAGTAITVDNAIPEAKRLAHFIGPSCDAGGVAEGLTWLLKASLSAAVIGTAARHVMR